MQVPEQYMVPYSHIQNKYRRIYAGMVACMDEGIGNITRTMDQLGLWKDTVLIFSTGPLITIPLYYVYHSVINGEVY